MHKVIINLHILYEQFMQRTKHNSSILVHTIKWFVYPPPKFCITIVFDLSWDDCNTQEKSETIVKQNLGVGGGWGGVNKVHCYIPRLSLN